MKRTREQEEDFLPSEINFRHDGPETENVIHRLN